MLKKLPIQLDEALRVFDTNQNVALDKSVINQLLNNGYIKHQFGGGWMLSSKGRRYIQEHRS